MSTRHTTKHAAMRLTDYPVLDTTDLPTARAGLHKAFSANTLSVAGKGERFRMRLNATQLQYAEIAYLDFDADVHIAGNQRDFFAIQLPLTGRCYIRQGDDSILSAPNRASIVGPRTPTEIAWPARSSAMVLKLGRAPLEQIVTDALGWSQLDQPLTFTPSLALDRGPLRTWAETVHLLVDDLDQGGPLVHHSLAMASLERVLLEGLVLSSHHNYTRALTAPARSAGPAAVRRAMKRIENHPDHALTTSILAREIGVSPRSLQQAFQHERGETAMRYLRTVRLQRVRADLIAARGQPGARVKAIATRWGFVHMGRFSIAYRQAFGETPSETLRPQRAS